MSIFPHFEVIYVTQTEYYTVGWMLFNIGWFFTAKNMFLMPDERQDDQSNY